MLRALTMSVSSLTWVARSSIERKPRCDMAVSPSAPSEARTKTYFDSQALTRRPPAHCALSSQLTPHPSGSTTLERGSHALSAERVRPSQAGVLLVVRKINGGVPPCKGVEGVARGVGGGEMGMLQRLSARTRVVEMDRRRGAEDVGGSAAERVSSWLKAWLLLRGDE